MTVLSELSKLSECCKCSKCQHKLVATESGIEVLGGLTTPSIASRDFIFQIFSIIDFITNFTCDLHKECGEKLAARTAVNIFFKNKQKHTNDSVRK